MGRSIITGANTGVGKELARLLYSKNAKVYIFARSEPKANQAIEDIKKAAPTSTGVLDFLPLDLSDLG
jgi:retinol dehydrogenase-12